MSNSQQRLREMADADLKRALQFGEMLDSIWPKPCPICFEPVDRCRCQEMER